MRTAFFAAFAAVAMLAATGCARRRDLHVPEDVVRGALPGGAGAFVIVDCSSGAAGVFDAEASAERLPPCSTFKIWNALAGLEAGVISSADEPFYKWDGQARSIAAWNRDLTLREAFQASCVPAFQDLARRIGRSRMQSWIERIDYGDRDASAGLDVFWLPAKGRKTVLISPREQAELIRRLLAGELPASAKSRAVLKELMTVRSTARGTLYGKTGSGADEAGAYVLGWFVGYVESRGRTHAFACAVKGKGVMGKDARAAVETILEKSGLL